MNSIVRYKIKGGIAKGVKKGEIIKYEEQRDISIKNYFKQIFRSRSTDKMVANNRIFYFKWEIERDKRFINE